MQAHHRRPVALRSAAAVVNGGIDIPLVIAHFAHEAGQLPAPPGDLVARPVAQWPFQRHHPA
jgi:hypothetical protein